MNSVRTIDLLDRGSTAETPATGFWRESYERHPKKAFDLFRMTRAAGLFFSLAASPVTAMPDPWLIERRQRDAVVTVSIYRELIARFVSRTEALRIAREILGQAERERLAFSEVEATRGIQWGVSDDL